MIRALFLFLAAAVGWGSSVGSAPLPKPLPFYYDLHTFRGAGGLTRVVGAFAVPAGRLKREWKDGEVRYRFDVSLVVADTARQAVSRSDDSVYVSVPRPLPGGHLLYTHVEFDAPPSRSTVHRVVMTDAAMPGVGQLYGSPFPIPDYSGDDLMLSDLAMGQPDPVSGWRRGDVTLALLPASRSPGSSFELYYEIYNLTPGAWYDTEIAIRSVDESGEPTTDGNGPVRTRFSGEAPWTDDGIQREFRFVEVSLGEGSYRITVTVTDQGSGSSVRQSRLFEVHDPGSGATMVPALPASRIGRQ